MFCGRWKGAASDGRVHVPFSWGPLFLLVESQPHAQNTGEIAKFAALTWMVKMAGSLGMMFCFCLRNEERCDSKLVAPITTESICVEREKKKRKTLGSKFASYFVD